MKKNRKSQPPSLAKKILSKFTLYDEDFLSIGDLEEEFTEKVEIQGIIKARNWFWKQVIKSIPAYLRYFISGVLDLFKNYFKSAIRQMYRQKSYTFLNLFGLAVGMSCFLIIFSWVQHERNFDTFHSKSNRIYRVNNKVTLKSGQPRDMVYTSAPMAQALINDYPEIKTAVRMRAFFGVDIKVNDKDFNERSGFFADPSFFEIFNFPLLKGSPKDVLQHSNCIVLSRKLANKLFGSEEPLGKSLLVNNESYHVTGVFKDIPTNSHLQFDYLASTKNIDSFENQNWGTLSIYTYILLEDNTQAETLEEKIQELNERHIGEWAVKTFQYHLQPITSIHLHSNLLGEYAPRTQISQLNLFSTIGILILIVACINYINLTTARYQRRLTEIGIRKVLGADRFRLIVQFLSESLLSMSLAIGAALILSRILSPVFGSLIEGNFQPHIGTNTLKIAGILLLVGLISGVYPAVFLSSFQAVSILRGRRKKGHFRSILRKGLIIFQFTVTVILMVGTGIVYTQIHFMKGKYLGFNEEDILVVRLNNPNLRQKYEIIKNEFLQLPEVDKATASGFLPLLNQDLRAYRPEGFGEDKIFVRTLYVDHDFIPTMELELKEGRNFSGQNSADALYGYIVNETAVKTFGWDSALGRQIEARGQGEDKKTAKGPVIGVLKDFHFRSFREKIGPLILRMKPERFDIINLKVKTENFSSLLPQLEAKWKEIDQESPFTHYVFMEDIISGTFRRDQRLGQNFSYLSLISILIACLGLLGLISYLAGQRTKEIGIRKIHGASVPDIIALLTKEILKLVVLANIIAWPIGYLLMSNWIKNFAYRASINPVIFISSALLALLITFITLSFQSIKAALANPIDSLRYE